MYPAKRMQLKLINQFLITVLKVRLNNKNDAAKINIPLIATLAGSGSEKISPANKMA